jgi:hypothetical protein
MASHERYGGTGPVWARSTPCAQTAAARVHMRTKLCTAAATVNRHRTRATPRCRTFRDIRGGDHTPAAPAMNSSEGASRGQGLCSGMDVMAP